MIGYNKMTRQGEFFWLHYRSPLLESTTSTYCVYFWRAQTSISLCFDNFLYRRKSLSSPMRKRHLFHFFSANIFFFPIVPWALPLLAKAASLFPCGNKATTPRVQPSSEKRGICISKWVFFVIPTRFGSVPKYAKRADMNAASLLHFDGHRPCNRNRYSGRRKGERGREKTRDESANR